MNLVYTDEVFPEDLRAPFFRKEEDTQIRMKNGFWYTVKNYEGNLFVTINDTDFLLSEETIKFINKK